MEQTFTEIFKEKGKCCISGKSMSDSEHINMVALDYAPEWAYPFEHNILHPNRPKRALAMIHDDEMPKSAYIAHGRIKFAVEFRDGEIIYHPVENLKPIRYEEEE